jgi:hypothetical protein
LFLEENAPNLKGTRHRFKGQGIKFDLEKAMKAQRGSRGVALLFL